MVGPTNQPEGWRAPMMGQPLPMSEFDKRITERLYSMPFLVTPEAVSPAPLERTTDVASAWQFYDAVQPMILRTLTPHPIYYTNKQPNAGDVALGKYWYASTGVCKLRHTGRWWFYVPSLDGSTTNNVAMVAKGIGWGPGADEQIREEEGAGPGLDNLAYIRSISKTVTAANTSTVGPTFSPPPGYRTILLSPGAAGAPSSGQGRPNSDVIYVAGNQTCPGFDNSIPLSPGNYVELPLSNWELCYFLSPSASQRLIFICCTNQVQAACS